MDNIGFPDQSVKSGLRGLFTKEEQRILEQLADLFNFFLSSRERRNIRVRELGVSKAQESP